MRVTVVGCGDAFGSGGRFQSSYLVEAAGVEVLLDAGATVTTALHRLGRDANAISAVVISHLHGDHFAGLVFLYMQALYATKRTTPLVIHGPIGTEGRFRAVAELLYPRSTAVAPRFELAFVEMRAGVPHQVGPLEAVAFEVVHPSGAPSHAVRLTDGKKVLAFSGDTQWTEALVDCGRAADLFIMECYRYEVTPSVHMGWKTIQPQLGRIGARRVLLTHMSDEMLAKRALVDDARVLLAEDGMVIEV